MSLKNDFSILTCALSGEDKHFIEKPITLLCGHSICKQCIPTDSKILCTICGKVDLTPVNDSVLINTLLESNFLELFEIISVRFNDSLKLLKGKTRK
jgi:hypothetical protein